MFPLFFVKFDVRLDFGAAVLAHAFAVTDVFGGLASSAVVFFVEAVADREIHEDSSINIVALLQELRGKAVPCMTPFAR